MSNKRQIKVPADYFHKARNDYADWLFAFFREIIQNSVDAGATTITFIIEEMENGGCRIQAIDNGRGMSLHILENKFFALRQTTKGNDNGSTGAFGVAKEIIAFAHDNYRVETNGWVASGEGGEYELNEIPNGFTGVSITVEMSDTTVRKAVHKLNHWVSMSTISADIILNGEILKKCTAQYGHKMSVPFGNIQFREVKDQDYDQSKLIVKMGGMPMFVRSQYATGGAFEAVLDLNGKSVEQLTSNRDSLRGNLESNLLEILDQLANDRGRLKMSEPITLEYNVKNHHTSDHREDHDEDVISPSCDTQQAVAEKFASGAQKQATKKLSDNELAEMLDLASGSWRANEEFARNLSRRMMRREYDTREQAQNKISKAMDEISEDYLPQNWIVRVGADSDDDIHKSIKRLNQRGFVKIAHMWTLLSKFVIMNASCLSTGADREGNIYVNDMPVKFGFVLDSAKALMVDTGTEYHFLINPILMKDDFSDDFPGIVETAVHEASHMLISGHNESMVTTFHRISKDVRMAVKNDEGFSGVGMNRLEHWVNRTVIRIIG